MNFSIQSHSTEQIVRDINLRLGEGDGLLRGGDGRRLLSRPGELERRRLLGDGERPKTNSMDNSQCTQSLQLK